MGFEKGHPKMGGRKKGTPNKARPVIREMLTQYTNTPKFWERFFNELESLEGRDYVNAAKGMFDIIEPKLTAVTAEVTEKKEDMTLIEKLQSLSVAAE